MKFILTDMITELVLPVTPDRFTIPHGRRVETVNLHTVGDVNFATLGKLPTIKLDAMFPAHAYPFVEPEANTDDPYTYVEQIKKWCDANTVLRFIVSDTPVNELVQIEEIDYGERDGTGDIYASITLRGYRELAVATTKTVENTTRAVYAPVATANTYTVESGDTLSGICRRFYGDASLFLQLASYNAIPNADLIDVDQVLEIPDVAKLQNTEITASYIKPVPSYLQNNATEI